VRPNVLHLLDTFETGGSERQAVQLVRSLHQSGRFRVHVACLNRRGPLLEDVERLGLGEIPEFPLTSFHDRNAAVQLIRFRRYVRWLGIDVLQTHDFYTNIFGMPAAALAGVRVRLAGRRETFRSCTRMQKWGQTRAYRLAHSIVANCEAVRRHLIGEGVRNEKIVTVYNGLDLERVTSPPAMRRQEALARFGLPAHPPRRFVTVVANLRLRLKDHPTFLRAARRVRQAVPEAAFVLAGEGELLPELRQYAARLGLERDTFFVGSCTAPAELLALSDVCALSSTSEGFSNVILEYMGAARPVVATDVGGAREAVLDGESGYLVPAGADEAMAARIIELLRDPARARAMGQRGRKAVEEKFSSQAQLERTENLYGNLLAPRLALAPAAELGES